MINWKFGTTNHQLHAFLHHKRTVLHKVQILWAQPRSFFANENDIVIKYRKTKFTYTSLNIGVTIAIGSAD